MHTLNLDPGLLHIRQDGQPASLADLLPRWGLADRLGVVVASPMGAVGAAGLIAAAVARFYEIRRTPEGRPPFYPEIYAFHVGRSFGDFSYFDFLPPRKEVVLPAADPLALLEAVNDRAITHLAVPAAASAPHDFIWQERNCAEERLVAGFAYDPSGRVEGADVVVRLDPELDDLALGVLRPRQLLIDWDPVATLGTPRAPKDDGRVRRDWLANVRRRIDETTEEERAAVETAYQACRRGGRVEQEFRRIGFEEVLSRLAGAALG